MFLSFLILSVGADLRVCTWCWRTHRFTPTFLFSVLHFKKNSSVPCLFYFSCDHFLKIYQCWYETINQRYPQNNCYRHFFVPEDTAGQ